MCVCVCAGNKQKKENKYKKPVIQEYYKNSRCQTVGYEPFDYIIKQANSFLNENAMQQLSLDDFLSVPFATTGIY